MTPSKGYNAYRDELRIGGQHENKQDTTHTYEKKIHDASIPPLVTPDSHEQR